MKTQLAIAAVVVIIVIVIGFFGWRSGKLNRILPDKWKHKSKLTSDQFRGAYGRTPQMTTCAIGGSLAHGLNACNYA
jgi:hypothetical protein